jgi:hypothetical protein
MNNLHFQPPNGWSNIDSFKSAIHDLQEIKKGTILEKIEPMHYPPFLRKLLPVFLFVLGLGSGLAANEGFQDIRFGPYVYNELLMGMSPVGDDRVLPIGSYRLQIGWIEPITLDGQSYANCTFIETDGHFDVSPYQTDFGTTFSIKPFRIFEFGLTYNRLIFNESLVGFDYGPDGQLPLAKSWSAGNVLGHQPASGVGADVFTFNAAFHLKVSRLSISVDGSRSLWDVDIVANELLYEYASDLLIKKRDRIHRLTSEIRFHLPDWNLIKPFSLQGITFQDRYVYTNQTRLEKNLLAFGLAGFRFGSDSHKQKRGLDLTLGYFTDHPQLKNADFPNRLYLSAEWKWNVDFLSASHL